MREWLLTLLLLPAIAGCGSGTQSVGEWKDDAHVAFSGMVLHGDPMPRQVTLADETWTRSDATGLIDISNKTYVATVFTCGDDDRRLVVFCEPKGSVAMHAAEQAKSEIDGKRRWVNDGWKMTVIGSALNRAVYFSRSENGKSAEQHGPFKIRRTDGQLVSAKRSD